MTRNPTILLIKVFNKLRRAGFTLGISELLDSAAALQGGWGVNSEEELKRIVRLLWCNSVEEMAEFDEAWRVFSLPEESDIEEVARPEYPSAEAEAKPTGEELLAQWPTRDNAPAIRGKEDLRPAPLRTPFNQLTPLSTTESDRYWPVSRRFLSYIWRYLRRPQNDGPPDLVNVEATVENAARRGFYLAPVFKRRTRNYAHLLLLVDRAGSMVPFHRFAGSVVETAQNESNLGSVEVFYFHDVVAEHLYTDWFLTEPVSVTQALENCTSDTSLLIISDAGAARGLRKTSRIRATAEFLFELRIHTQFIAWLNPLPEERWLGTTAQIVSHLVPMFQMDDDGLSNAIDVVRGQPIFRRTTT